MKSVRLDPVLAERLERAAQIEGVSQSEFIRRAVDKACDEALRESLAERLKDVIGAVKGGSGDLSEDTGRKFTDLLLAKQKRQKV